MSHLIENFEKSFLKKDCPNFRIGDTVSVHMRIKELEEVEEEKGNGNGNGNKKAPAKAATKERIQVFTGTVIAKKGSGLSETFTVYRNAYGCSMEKVFLLHSPKLVEVKVMRSGKVRRAKLNYIRGQAGKAAKIKEKMGLFNKKTVLDEALEAGSDIAEIKIEKKPAKKAKPEQEKPETEK